MDKSRILGIDIGGTHIRLGLVNAKGAMDAFEIHKSQPLFAKNPIASLGKEIKQYLLGKDQYKAEAIVIGFPSTIDKERKIVLSTPNIQGLNQVPVVEGLTKELDLPIFIEKDVNLLFEFDLFDHQFPRDSTVLGFYVGTGLGNAIQVEGKLLVGKNGVAGELGHIPTLGDEKPCPCGNRGCIEGLASGKYLEEIKSKYFPTIEIGQIFTQKGTEPIILEFVEHLSVPIAAEINIFDPDHVVLGGGVLTMADFPKKLLEQNILNHTRKPFPYNNLAIDYSNSHQQSGVIGAGIHGYKMLGKL